MLAFLLSPALMLQAVPPTTVLAPDSEARWVPFTLTPANQIRFAMQVNGHPAQAILDTGLSDTIVMRRFADIAGLRPGPQQRATAIGGAVTIRWARSDSLALGGLTRSGARVGISDEAGQERFGADLLLGSDVLNCCAVEIDYDARRFRILPSGRMPFTGATAPIAHTRNTSVPVSALRIGGRLLRLMIVDTGDGSAITLSREAWTAAAPTGIATTTTIGWGLGGAILSDLAVVPGARLGASETGEAEVRIEGAGGYSAQADVAGRIGNALLMRYRVLIDPRAGRMVLAPGKTHGAPVVRSTSGLLMAQESGSLRVIHVMRGSPAAAGGWRAEERICEVDGALVMAMPGAIDWGAGSPGRSVRLRLCDGQQRTLTLRRFY